MDNCPYIYSECTAFLFQYSYYIICLGYPVTVNAALHSITVHYRSIGGIDVKLGKLTPDTLEALLSRVPVSDPRVILGPKVGEDAALLDFGDEVLVAKTDPITFATDLIGWYAVHVNANDVACAGAKPRWFMATLLLPQQNERKTKRIRDIFGQITDACDSLGVTLVGGHTEVTQNLDQPIIVGCMLGVAPKDRALTTGGARVGDYVILTKGVSLEGSALLAREQAEVLREGRHGPIPHRGSGGTAVQPRHQRSQGRPHRLRRRQRPQSPRSNGRRPGQRPFRKLPLRRTWGWRWTEIASPSFPIAWRYVKS